MRVEELLAWMEGRDLPREERVDALLEAADTVCANAEAHEEQWSARDYDLYEPLREAIDALKDPR